LSEEESVNAQTYFIKLGYFFNLDPTFEIFFILRGCIAGVVIIQIAPSDF
jgi:hypothetical protein